MERCRSFDSHDLRAAVLGLTIYVGRARRRGARIGRSAAQESGNGPKQTPRGHPEMSGWAAHNRSGSAFTYPFGCGRFSAGLRLAEKAISHGLLVRIPVPIILVSVLFNPPNLIEQSRIGNGELEAIAHEGVGPL